MIGRCTHTLLVGLGVFLLVAMALPLLAEDELDLRPIQISPETLTELHPKVAWMTDQKIRGIWIGNDLFEKYEDGDKTKAQVIADAGFNLVSVSMTVNTDGQPSVDTSKPLEAKYDRTKSTDLETRLAKNVAEARRAGLKLMITWKYGSFHLEPYRKYRSFDGQLAKLTCCPLDKTYITGQHVGKWVKKIAKGGADGVIIDMEMYQSDKSTFDGSCTCDECFTNYLKKFAKDWKAVYNKVPAETRGKWLTDHKADEHYSQFAARRVEELYDTIRRKCQKINPAFFFGIAPVIDHLPGVERGLGTSKVPCLVFSEYEYHCGPYRGSYRAIKHIRENLPALFLCGTYVAVQPPEMLADNALMAPLYTDGWWAWYGTALLTNTRRGEDPGMPYGRAKDTSASDYLDLITQSHAKLDKVLASPKSEWPERKDGMPDFLKAQIAQAEAEAAKSDSEEARKAVAEAKASLERYLELVRQGGY